MKTVWKAAVAILVAAAYGEWYATAISSQGAVFRAHAAVGNAIGRIFRWDLCPNEYGVNCVAQACTWFLPVAVIAVAVFALLSRHPRSGGAGAGDEKHCRKCKYVLRGLKESRCPECGTKFDPGLIQESVPEGSTPKPWNGGANSVALSWAMER